MSFLLAMLGLSLGFNLSGNAKGGGTDAGPPAPGGEDLPHFTIILS